MARRSSVAPVIAEAHMTPRNLDELWDRLSRGIITDSQRQTLLSVLREIVNDDNRKPGERGLAAMLLAAEEARSAHG